MPWQMVLVILGVLVAVPPAQAQSDYPFGKIFTTEQQRQRLDLFRDTGKSPVGGSRDSQTDSGGTAVDVTRTDQVRFSGYMLRSDGTQMVWIDGGSELSGAGAGSAGSSHGRVTRRDGSLVFRARSEQARLKPGQVWLLNEDAVAEVFDVPRGTPDLKEADELAQPE